MLVGLFQKIELRFQDLVSSAATNLNSQNNFEFIYVLRNRICLWQRGTTINEVHFNIYENPDIIYVKKHHVIILLKQLICLT